MPSYYRSDVPKKSPYRNLIAIVVILLVGFAIYSGVRFLWGFAQARSTAANADLERAVLNSGAHANVEGFAWADSTPSPDDIENVLVLTVNDVNIEKPELKEVHILSLNKTASLSHYAYLPSSTLVEKEDGYNVALNDLFREAETIGLAGAQCADRLAAYEHVRFHHIMLISDGTWNDVLSLCQEADSPFAITTAAGLLSRMKVDLDADGLLEFASGAKAAGIAGAEKFDAHVENWYDEYGNAWKWVPAEPLCIALGTTVVNEGEVAEIGGVPIDSLTVIDEGAETEAA